MRDLEMKEVIYYCISNILIRENKTYAKLSEIYEEVATYLEVENNYSLQSQIRGRLQNFCNQYSNFKGPSLFKTEKVRSGNWTIVKQERKCRFVRYINNTYLVTNDNWISQEKREYINESYEREENNDNIYKAKLIEEEGRERSEVILEELRKIRNLLRKIKGIDKVNDGFGTAFEVFAIAAIYNITYEEVINKYIINGDLDGKIDAIYYGKPGEVHIYQIKLSDISDTAYDMMRRNYNMCNIGQIPENGRDLYNFVTKNINILNDRIPVYKSISKNSRKNTNNTPKQIYEKFFINRLLPKDNNGLTLYIRKPELSNGFDYQYNVSTDGNNNFFFYIKANDLIDCLLEALGITSKDFDKEKIAFSKYFYNNVRGKLPSNKKIEYTIENEPENFIKYNNGINITGNVIDQENKIKIENPVINNGQQTITTLIELNKNLDKIMLPIKITNETDKIVRGKISQFSNEQQKVKSIDMLSINSFIRDIQVTIVNREYNGERYFLDIYSSGEKGNEDIIRKIYKDSNIISLLDFIKLYFSVENSKDLGAWKNSAILQVEETNINNPFSVEKAFKVCDVIRRFDNYLNGIEDKVEKDNLKSSDLAFKYLLCRENLNEEEAKNIISEINNKYYYNGEYKRSKLIDIYKSPTIINKIEKELQLYRKKKDKVTN